MPPHYSKVPFLFSQEQDRCCLPFLYRCFSQSYDSVPKHMHHYTFKRIIIQSLFYPDSRLPLSAKSAEITMLNISLIEVQHMEMFCEERRIMPHQKARHAVNGSRAIRLFFDHTEYLAELQLAFPGLAMKLESFPEHFAGIG